MRCLGGELFEQIAALDGHGFCEKDCITIIHQIAKAVKYMHSMGIVHRDLKPENILCVEMNSIKKIKIADFGISKVIFDPEQRRKERERRKRQQAKRDKIRKQQMEQALSNNNSNSQSNSQSNSNYEMKINDDDMKMDDMKHDYNEYNNNNNNNNGKQRRGKQKNFIDPLKRSNGQPKGYGQHSQQQLQQHQQHQQQANQTHMSPQHSNLHHSNAHHSHHHSHHSKQSRASHKRGKKSNNHIRDESTDDYKRGVDYTMTTMCGTISYTAPEILQELPYDRRVDYWSLGVIMYILLCGYPPFAGESEIEVARSILRDEVELEPEDWEHVSQQGRELVLGLLEKDPRKRKSCDDIIGHSWIQTAKNSTSKRARASLIKTVVKRRIRKMSMGVFEQNSKRLNKMYKSRDDSSVCLFICLLVLFFCVCFWYCSFGMFIYLFVCMFVCLSVFLFCIF